jgi:acyl-CoA thioester hydrolase
MVSRLVQHVRVDAQHIDGLGHVNNVVYLQWAEQVAWRHSEALGLGLEAYQALDAAMVARQHTLTYLVACVLGDELQLETWLGERNALHLYRHYRFIRVADGVVVFEGQTDWVCIRLSTGRPLRMPAAFKAAYGVA